MTKTMKIAIVGPGIMSIPPVGWGAVEILIWDVTKTLEKLGHEIKIINTPNRNEIIQQVAAYAPDFTHVQYDDFIDIYPHIPGKKAITSHYGYLEQPQRYGDYSRIANAFCQVKPNVFCLSPGILQTYEKRYKLPKTNLFLTPNGVNSELFEYRDQPKYSDRSLYLAKIDYRKRQTLYQGIEGLYFAGRCADGTFNVDSPRYLGEWSKAHLYANLTDYSNLVLISDGEAHPLVCMEAMAAGLGLVVSEAAIANLDLTKRFITVIPENMTKNIDYVKAQIEANRAVSNTCRKEIKEYSKLFAWKSIVEKYYLPAIQQVLSK